MSRARSGGFTLVELIAVMVVLSIVSVMGSGFVANLSEQYAKAQVRSSMVQKGSVVMEQLSRRLRMAAPNTVRVSASGSCVEYLPVLGAAFYVDEVADGENGVAAASAIDVVSFDLSGGFLTGDPAHVLIAPLAVSEVYTSASPSSRSAAGDFGSAPFSQLVLASSHRFIRNSVSHRALVTAEAERLCVVDNQVVRRHGYSFTTQSLSDVSPGGSEVVMAEPVSSGEAFVLSAASEDRNAVLAVNLVFDDRGESVSLSSRVLIRNVP